jgi:hypothetical protein
LLNKFAAQQFGDLLNNLHRKSNQTVRMNDNHQLQINCLLVILGSSEAATFKGKRFQFIPQLSSVAV